VKPVKRLQLSGRIESDAFNFPMIQRDGVTIVVKGGISPNVV